MPEPKTLPISPFCGKLRSKKYYFLTGPAMTEDDILDGSQDCWCSATGQKVGPDQRIVEPSDCQSGRSCFIPFGKAKSERPA